MRSIEQVPGITGDLLKFYEPVELDFESDSDYEKITEVLRAGRIRITKHMLLKIIILTVGIHERRTIYKDLAMRILISNF
jgi:hypothetical protein